MMFIYEKFLKQQYNDNVMDAVLFIVCKIYFGLFLSKLLPGFEGNITFSKKYILRQPWNDSAAFT